MKFKNYFIRAIFKHINNFIIKTDELPPDGFYLSAFDYLKEFPDKDKLFYKEIYPETNILATAPKQADENAKNIFGNRTEFKYPADFYLNIPNSKLWGYDGIVITHNNKVIDNVNLEFTSHVRPISQHEIFSEFKLAKPEFIEGNVAVLTTMWSDFYYHWMLDILPKFDLIEKTGITFDKVIINGSNNRFQKESLKKFNISEEKIIWTTPKTHIKASNMFVFSIPACMEFKPERIINYLKEKFQDNLVVDKNMPEKIYISRGKAFSRRIINEEEVKIVLDKEGFAEIFLEDYSVEEQAKLFYNAKVILSSHGGGLTNLIFCKKCSTKVIEIFSKNHIIPCYWAIANALNLDYYCLVGIDFLKTKYNREDILIDIKQLQQIINIARIPDS